jgi:hypothetical protein
MNITELNQIDQDRFRRYQEHLDFYNGIQRQGQSRVHPEGSPERERRLTFNYAKVFIDKITSYLLSGMSFVAQSFDEGDKVKRAEEVIGQVRDENRLDALDYDTEIDTAILGDGCYKVSWNSAEKRVRVTAPDVRGIYAWWTPDDPSQIYRVISKYQLYREEVEILYHFKPANTKSIVVEDWTKKEFALYIDNQQVQRQKNPYGFIPFVIFPNLREPKRFWGLSDIPQFVQPQREFNRAITQLSHILELSGNPIAVLENVESSEDIAVAPGAVWNIPPDSRAYLLDLLKGGGAKLHLDYIELLYRTLHDLSETPRTAFGIGGSYALSGVAMQLDLQPLIQKVHRKRIIRSAAYQKRNQMILDIIRKYTQQDFSGIRHQINWSGLLPEDYNDLVKNEIRLTESALHSYGRAMTNLGIENPDAELQKWLEEKQKLYPLSEPLGADPGKETD